MDMIDVIAWLFYLATLVERIVELRVSLRNAALSFSQGGVEYGKDHYKWMVLMHAGFLLAMILEFAWFGSDIAPPWRIVAMAGAVFCQVLRWWVITTLGPQWNTRVIIVPGASRVTSGPYRYVRHPNYMVVALEVVLLPLIFGAWRTALVFSVLNALILRARIRVEDKALSALRSP